MMIFRLLCLVALVGGVGVAWWGYAKHEYAEHLSREKQAKIRELEAQMLHQEAQRLHEELRGDPSGRDMRHLGEQMLVGGAAAAGLGLLGLIASGIAAWLRPKVSYGSHDELIAAEMKNKLQPGEQVLNTAYAMRGSGVRWSWFCVALTNQRLVLFLAWPSWLVGLRLVKGWEEEHPVSEIRSCTTDQHWKGHDVIFEFPKYEILLRLNLAGKQLSGTRQFWEEVPARFPRPQAGARWIQT